MQLGYVCMDRLCLAHCWAVNRRWLWQEVGITILPMSLVFIFCLFRQPWLLHTYPSQILLHTQQLFTLRCVFVCVQVVHVRMLCIEVGVDDCLLSQKGNWMCFFRDVGWVRGKIRQDVTCLVYCICEHLYMYMCVKRRIWSGSDEASHMLCGRKYILQHTLVCMHWTLIENKASFSQGQWHTDNAHLRLTMLQIETMKGQRTHAYTDHKVPQWYFFWMLGPGCFQTGAAVEGGLLM